MADRGELALGDEAKDSITGLRGVVIAITEWLNGCQRIVIQPRELHEGRPVEGSTFDVEQMVLVKRAGETQSRRKTGGPHDMPTRQVDQKR